jgi:hypothetical protein
LPSLGIVCFRGDWIEPSCSKDLESWLKAPNCFRQSLGYAELEESSLSGRLFRKAE